VKPPRRGPGDGAGPALPRDPFGRRDPKAPGRLDFLFDTKRHPEPKGGAAGLEATAAKEPAAAGATSAKEPAAAETSVAPATSASTSVTATATANAGSSAEETRTDRPVKAQNISLAKTVIRFDAPPPAPPTGFKRTGFQAMAFVPAPVLTVVEVVAIVVCGVIAAVFTPRR
jgi:hypothetical protein